MKPATSPSSAMNTTEAPVNITMMPGSGDGSDHRAQQGERHPLDAKSEPFVQTNASQMLRTRTRHCVLHVGWELQQVSRLGGLTLGLPLLDRRLVGGQHCDALCGHQFGRANDDVLPLDPRHDALQQVEELLQWCPESNP